MAPLASQLIELKLGLLHVGGTEESAAKSASGGDPGHQQTQLPDHINLIAEHASLQETHKAIEMKCKDLVQKLDTKKREEESLQVEFEKLNRQFHSKQANFTSLQATLDDLRKEHTHLKDDHKILETQHQELQSRVEDYKRSEFFFIMYIESIMASGKVSFPETAWTWQLMRTNFTKKKINTIQILFVIHIKVVLVLG